MKKQKNEESVLTIHFHDVDGHHHLHTNQSKETVASWLNDAINEGDRFVELEDSDGDPFFLSLERVNAISVVDKDNFDCGHEEEN